MDKMTWLAGTSGYSYKEWKGTFYPDKIAAADMLAYYAKQLNAVEINNTFYRMPRTDVLRTWADAVPSRFRFSIKASRRITHHARLNDCAEAVGYLVKGVEVLEDKLGAVLLQLPPFLKKDSDRLAAFLKIWPGGIPAAIEFRHPSWFDDETFDQLSGAGVALCVSEDGTLPIPGVVATTSMLYLRLRKPEYDSRALTRWIGRGWTSDANLGFAFFKHEDAGAGPKLASRFLSLTSKPTPKRAATRPGRPRRRA